MELSHNSAHVLLFPFPANGHIKPFLCLAQLLCNAGLEVTVLNTDHNHGRLDNRSRLSQQFPSLHFDSIPDGLAPDEPRNALDSKLYLSFLRVAPPLFRELLISYNNGSCCSGRRSPVSCVITDVIMGFPVEVGEELGIPVFSFCVFSARFLFLYHWIPNLYEDGQLPPLEAGNTNQKIHGVPGGEGLLRCKDLPGYLGVKKVEKNNAMKFLNQTTTSSRTSGLIINTFDELEAPFFTSLSKIYNKIYTIGPIHSLLKNSPCGLWKEDHNCLSWLDSQSPRSVVFVCFGSLVRITSLQLMELWNGLINSGKPFLLALRWDIVEKDEEKQVVKEIMETKLEGRCLVVSWAPQEKVLAHGAIGGFLTHAGWNSILESIEAGVPMICWPQIGDQTSNSTWVSKVWKIGFEMKDRNDRTTIETMVKSIMEHEQNEDMKTRIEELKEQVKNRASKDGISNQNLKTLVKDIKKMKLNWWFDRLIVEEGSSKFRYFSTKKFEEI